MSRAVAVDLGGTNVRAAVVSQSGGVLESTRELVGEREPRALAGQIARLVTTLGAAGDHPVTVAVAGSVWIETGVVLNAPNLGWREVPFASLLSEALGRRVRLVNDLNAIAYGEALVGAGRGAADVCCLFIGTGVGMGAVVGGRLLEGADGLAPELGHVKVASADVGRLCGCGQRGCVEAYVSGRHLPELLLEKVAGGAASELVAAAKDLVNPLRADAIDAAARRGDPAAVQLWDEVAERIAWAMGLCIMTLNPRVLVLGGGVLGSAPRLYELTMERLWRHAWAAFGTHLQVRPTALGDDAGIVGAALLGLRVA